MWHMCGPLVECSVGCIMGCLMKLLVGIITFFAAAVEQQLIRSALAQQTRNEIINYGNNYSCYWPAEEEEAEEKPR